MRHFFVINPHSFPKPDDLKRIISDIPRYFLQTGGAYKIYTSRYPRDAVAAVHHYIEQFSQEETIRVYAIGGDGILFDCLNGMMGFPNVQLTCVPYGKSNSFIRSFGKDALQKFRDIPALINGTPHRVDLIYTGSHYTLNQIVLGLEAQGVLSGNEFLRKTQLKWIKPFSSKIYMFCALRHMLNKEVIGQWYRVNIDGDDFSGRYYNINIANGACSGRTGIPSPFALPNDGLLNVIFTKTGPWFSILKAISAYYKGKFLQHEFFFEQKATLIKITSNTPIRVHMDGEPYLTYALRLELMKDAVQFVAPEGLTFYDYSQKGGQSQ